MAEIPIKVRCLGDICKGCPKMEIDNNGVHFIDCVRGLPVFDPHCKHIDVCQNLLNMRWEEEKKTNKINLNDWIKVKLTAYGKDIHSRHFTKAIQGIPSLSKFKVDPEVDKDGFTKYQLWCFIEIFGAYIGMAEDNVIMPLDIYIVSKEELKGNKE